ncbi:MAG: HDIG domain-containing protein [Euryarchaeota archaeon]|nr:HDIG domain-containing protein [Euryarchaeota archaeon]
MKDMFPYLEKIEDKSLRKKVEKVMENAMENWKGEDIQRIPFTLLVDTNINLVDHINIVTDLSYSAGRVLKKRGFDINMDYLIAGALLHDIGKFLEYEKKGDTIVQSKAGKMVRHPVSGAGLAMKFNLPMEIVSMIAGHSKEGEFIERPPEGIIIHHSDFIHFENVKSL